MTTSKIINPEIIRANREKPEAKLLYDKLMALSDCMEDIRFQMQEKCHEYDYCILCYREVLGYELTEDEKKRQEDLKEVVDNG